MKTIDRTQIHEKAVEYAACNLIENDITTKACDTRGVDLVLKNGKTISVRGQSNEIASPLMNGTLGSMQADYVVIATNLKYSCTRRIHIMTMSDAKRIAQDRAYKSNGRSSWFIDPKSYRGYRENYDVLTE